MTYRSRFLETYLNNEPSKPFKTGFEGFESATPSAFPEKLEHWLCRGFYTVIRLSDEAEAIRCAEELSPHFAPGKVEAIGESVQIDNRRSQGGRMKQ